MKTCFYCGKNILDNDKFCGWCGKKVIEEKQIIKEAEENKEKAKEERGGIEKIEEKAKEEEIVELIKEKAKEERGGIEKTEEKAKEERIINMIRKRAEEEKKSIVQKEERKEKIIEKLTIVPEKEKEIRENYLRRIGVKKQKPKESNLSSLEQKKEEVVFRPVLQTKPSVFEKIWIRVLLLILIISTVIAVLVFIFDILKIKEGITPIPSPETATTTESIEEHGEITVFPPLFRVDGTEELMASSLEAIPSLFSKLLKAELQEKSFTRVVIKNLEENKVVGLKEFLEAVGIETPKAFYEYLNDNFTLFIYSPLNNHFGFTTQIEKKEELEILLEEWRKTIKSDLDPLFLLTGKEKLMVTHPIEEEIHLGVTYFYTDFYQESFGIYYCLIKNYFIFTTSKETMLQMIEFKSEITEELDMGSRGIEVEILQAWLAKDINIYPDRLVTGYFGSLSKEAVIRFQQKYADEILKPWGILEGTGIVDQATREKLNNVHQR